MDDLIAIGEFSVRSGLSARRLRSYAADGLLVPAAVDAGSGYRYYSPAQLPEAALVEVLRRAGMPLAEIRELMRSPSVDLLDTWGRRLERDAVLRREALAEARRLVGAPLPPGTRSEERKNSGEEEKAMRLAVAGRTETGLVRERNEDAVVFGERLAGVADGLGGAPGGEVASGLAVALVEAVFDGGSAEVLVAAVRAANRAIWERGQAEEGLQGMGTTICAVGLVGPGDLAVVNVGDSRTYLARAGSLLQLTEDHSVAADLVRRGELAPGDLLHHPHRAILTRALGVGPDVEVDRTLQAVMPGDRLLLCTDGLFTEVPDGEIAATVTGTGDLQAAADRLVDLALAGGGRDNVSVVVAQVEP